MRSRQICGGPGSGTVKGGLAGRVQRAEKVLGGSPANLARVVAASDPSTIVEHIVWLRDASGAPAPPPPSPPPSPHLPRAPRRAGLQMGEATRTSPRRTATSRTTTALDHSCSFG